MVFSSILFIFRFLPVALVIYYLAPHKIKNLILLILSLIFYSWEEIRYFLIMLLSIGVDFFIGKAIQKNIENKKIAKRILFISIIFNIGLLGFFKYFNFFLGNINSIFSANLKFFEIALPLGISFYTFQTMYYNIDVYRQNIKAEENIIDFAAYVSLFPQLIAGPIIKYSDVQSDIKNTKNRVSQEKIEKGIEFFILGLARKVLIANNVGMLWNEIIVIGFDNISTGLAWLGILAFTIQIYFDFSGYSLMARGLGLMLGFTFTQNFNYPFISRSVSEFWRRWHITLGSWFKEYVYIPLGGNRKSKNRLVLNLFLVWFLTGFWHGASYNFILWGVYFFIFIMIEKLFLANFLKKHRIISHIYLISVILTSFSIFAITDLRDLKVFLIKLFSVSTGIGSSYYLINYGVVLLIAIILSTPIINMIYEKYIKRHSFINAFILVTLFIVSISYLVDSSYNPFLYFRF